MTLTSYEIKKAMLLLAIALLVSENAYSQPQQTGQEYLKRGIAHFHAGDLDMALAEANAAIELSPSLVEAYRLRHIIRASKNPSTESADDCDIIIRLAPDAPTTEPYYVCRGNARARNLNWKGATSDMTKAIAMNPDYPEAYADRGLVFTLQGNFDRAVQDIQKAFALKPSSIADRVLENSFGEPFAEVSSFIRSYPNHARAYLVRGMFNLLQKRQADATNDFKRATELQPGLRSAIDRIIGQLRN